MSQRTIQLEALGLSPTLLRIAAGDLPHPAFEAVCEPLHVDKRRKSWGLELDRVEARPETGGVVAAAMWEHDVGDGHAFEVVYCGKGSAGVEFWHVMYADDMPGPCPELIARSEQGLFFWLFFFLIASEFSMRGEQAYATMVAAANAVGFEHLIEVFRLEQEIGTDHKRRGELTRRSLALA